MAWCVDCVRCWLDRVRARGAIPNYCKAIYIALFGAEVNCFVQFIGSNWFDPGDMDWACEGSGSYPPSSRYLNTEVPTVVNHEDVLRDLVQWIRQFRLSGGSLLCEVDHVAVGLDDGELTLMRAR